MTIMSPGNVRLLAWLPISIALAMTAWGGEPAPPGSILVVDVQTLAVIRIDPATGTQSVVTSGGLITQPNGLAVNTRSRRLDRCFRRRDCRWDS